VSLKDKILDDVKQSMRDKNQSRLDTLRLLTAAIKQREVDERVVLDDAQVLAVIDKQIKKARESIEQYDKGGRADLAAKEHAEIAVWQAYLPAALPPAEIDKLIGEAINEAGAQTIKDMGKVMGILKPKLQGRADVGQVSAQVRAKLGA
jgi:uncharacterized protein